MKTRIVTVVTFLFLVSCNHLELDDPTPAGPWERCDPADRVGCLCNDGSEYASTDSNVCANNGGLKRYICKWE